MDCAVFSTVGVSCRCISGVCGDCPEGYQTVEEMGVCRAHGECAWGQCSRQSSCSIGYTATESSVCRVGSYFLTKNYCCEDKPKKRCCQVSWHARLARLGF